jgi:hypothetical protein
MFGLDGSYTRFLAAQCGGYGRRDAVGGFRRGLGWLRLRGRVLQHTSEHPRDGVVVQRVNRRVQGRLQNVVIQSVDQLVELRAHPVRLCQAQP